MVPFLDLRAQHQEIRSELQAAAAAVLESADFVLGRYVEAFEAEFAAYCQTRFAIAVNSGTSALHLALLAAGTGPGDEVITTPFTFLATAAAIEYCGARPVFVDIQPDSFHLDPALLERAITAKTRALLPVHLYGLPVDMDEVLQVAARHGLAVIEDAAQAHGAEYRGRRAGGLGNIGCFSFYPTKNLGACGEGGAVTTDNEAIAERIRLLRNWGQTSKYDHVTVGFNYRMDGMQAALLSVKLRRLDDWTCRRQRLANHYSQALAGCDLVLPLAPADRKHVYHTYTVRSAQRALIRDRLNETGVQTAVHYPKPLHLQPAFRHLGLEQGAFPVSERAASEVLSLPMHPHLSAAQVQQVAESVRAAHHG